MFDAINSAKIEAINHANGKDAALGLAVEARLKVYVKWALTKANTNKHAGWFVILIHLYVVIPMVAQYWDN